MDDDKLDKILLAVGVAQSLSMAAVEIMQIVNKEEFTAEDFALILDKQDQAYEKAMARLNAAIDSAE